MLRHFVLLCVFVVVVHCARMPSNKARLSSKARSLADLVASKTMDAQKRGCADQWDDCPEYYAYCAEGGWFEDSCCETCQQVSTTGCPAGYLNCQNGMCVPEDWRCDGDNDCGNRADEQECSGAGGCQDYYSTCSDFLDDCNDLENEDMQVGCCATCAAAAGEGGGCASTTDNAPAGVTDCADSTGGSTVIAQPTCGSPKASDISSFIVGGEEATKHSIPWQLSVQDPTGFHFCGATIINADWALTAAHCVNEGDDIRVVAGAHSKSRYSRDGGKKYTVEKIYKHAGYDATRMVHDIALLKIKGGMKLSEKAMPACLPDKCHSWQPGTSMMVSGWGTLESGGSSPDKLQYVEVPLIDLNTCQRRNDMDCGWDHVICAAFDEGGKDSCQGDSGGPLVTKVDGKFTLAGVVSWGYGCADAGLPGVYAHVSHYLDWMAGIINGN